MRRNKEFHDYIVYDAFKDIPGITSRPMFSGWGIYKDGKIFSLIIGGELYFKVSDKNRSEFEKSDSHPFVYPRKGKSITMSYWTLPDEILENKEILLVWINNCFR